MHLNNTIELDLKTIITLLCVILLYNFLRTIRLNFPYRVNCWSCNTNFWVKFSNRNSWTCRHCEQYNGFTNDGDYNKLLIPNKEATFKTPNVFRRQQPQNGLCKKCNINQEFKIKHLACFVPVCDSNYDLEVEEFRSKLDKAYKLCGPCKRVVKTKLHKEKEVLLGRILLQTRSADKKITMTDHKYKRLKDFINTTSVTIAGILLLLTFAESCNVVMKNDATANAVKNCADIIHNLLERLLAVAKMKAFQEYPSLEEYCDYIHDKLNMDYGKIFNNAANYFKIAYNYYDIAQKALSAVGFMLQIFGRIFQIKNIFIIDVLWAMFVVMSLAQHTVSLDPLLMCVTKIIFIAAVLIVYHNLKFKKPKGHPAIRTPPTNRLKNLSNGNMSLVQDDSSSTNSEEDDDVSLSKFGLLNGTDSSNETVNSTMFSGRAFTPRSNDSLWSKPMLNSSFCVNSTMNKSPTAINDSFVKPTYRKTEKMIKDDSDSDLDEGISCLNLGSPKKPRQNAKSVFLAHKTVQPPSFVTPHVVSLSQRRPLISPSVLGHSTSWVAGGYWGADGNNRQTFNVEGSRSSSQSSGFESQTSSGNQRNVFSHPPSREESVCGESDRTLVSLDRFPNSSGGLYHNPQNFSHLSTPIYPQMQYDSHVHIPQPRLPTHAHSARPPQVFGAYNSAYRREGGGAPHYTGWSTFKAPAGLGSGLIKLPEVDTFPH